MRRLVRRAAARRRSAATGVARAASVLWPGSPAPRLTRRRSPSSRSFVLLPSAARPRYLVPAAPGAAVALGVPVAGPRGLPTRVLGRLQRHSVLPRLPLARVEVDAADGIEALLSAVLGEPVHDVVVRLGRPRPHRTIVAWALDPAGRPLAVAKLGRGEPTRAALEREHAILVARAADPVPGVVAPEPLGYLRWNDHDVLVISALVRPDARTCDEPPLAAMAALAGVGATAVPLRATALVGHLTDRVAALRGPADREWLGDVLVRLLGRHGEVAVPPAAWHGDWVSWNMTVSGGSVLLWDWEHFDADALLGFDHLHFLAQRQRARGTDEASEQAWLDQATSGLRSAWGLLGAQAEAVVAAYLLEVNLRYVEDRQDEPDLPPRRGWSRALLDRLLPDPVPAPVPAAVPAARPAAGPARSAPDRPGTRSAPVTRPDGGPST